MEDIKKYGGDEIYSFSTLYENTLTTNSLYNSDALGQVPYYKSSNCNMDSGEFINSGCNLDYKFSFIKEILDGWATDNIDSSDISVDKYGYGARILNIDEITNSLYFEYQTPTPSIGDYFKTSLSPKWLKNIYYNS